MLGTSAMIPTKTRNHSAFFISYDSEGLLFDCGEGTQRQLRLAGIRLTKVTKIFISHWHGDHVLGLPGLIQSLASDEYQKTLHIYGPKGTIKKVKLIQEIFPAKDNIKMVVKDIDEGLVVKTPDYVISTLPLIHNPTSQAYSFTENDKRKINLAKTKKLGIPEGPLLGKLQAGKTITHKNKKINPDNVTRVIKGKKITYIADTKNCKNAITLSKNSDIIISESTYKNTEREKADKYFHMTSSDAAHVAQMSNSKKLILTHFSQRYKDLDELLEEAKEIFPETHIAFDFMKIKL